MKGTAEHAENAEAQAREPWQMDGLTPGARWLLERVDDAPLSLETLDWTHTSPTRPAKAAAELEQRLLVHSESYHTDRGHHSRRLTSWPTWAVTAHVRPVRSHDASRRALHALLAALAQRFDVSVRAPWETQDRPLTTRYRRVRARDT